MDPSTALQAMTGSFLLLLFVIICANVLWWVAIFFAARWFLLHVFAIQQKRFFTQLDIFLHQRGIAPHIPEAAPVPSPQPKPAQTAPPSPVKTAVRDLAAEVDNLIAKARPAPSETPTTNRTPLERAWHDLNNPNKPPPNPGDDSRFKPQG
jgi:hypothetical protein